MLAARRVAAAASRVPLQQQRNASLIASKYAQALFGAASKNAQTLNKVQSELTSISNNLREVPTFGLDAIYAAAAPKGSKEPVTPITKNFFNELVSKHKGELEVVVTSAAPLEKGMLSKLETTLKSSQAASQAKSVRVTNKVSQPSILGGLLVDFGDKTIDLSVSSKVNRLNALLQRWMFVLICMSSCKSGYMASHKHGVCLANETRADSTTIPTPHDQLVFASLFVVREPDWLIHLLIPIASNWPRTPFQNHHSINLMAALVPYDNFPSPVAGDPGTMSTFIEMNLAVYRTERRSKTIKDESVDWVPYYVLAYGTLAETNEVLSPVCYLDDIDIYSCIIAECGGTVTLTKPQRNPNKKRDCTFRITFEGGDHTFRGVLQDDRAEWEWKGWRWQLRMFHSDFGVWCNSLIEEPDDEPSTQAITPNKYDALIKEWSSISTATATMIYAHAEKKNALDTSPTSMTTDSKRLTIPTSWPHNPLSIPSPVRSKSRMKLLTTGFDNPNALQIPRSFTPFTEASNDSFYSIDAEDIQNDTTPLPARPRHISLRYLASRIRMMIMWCFIGLGGASHRMMWYFGHEVDNTLA
ncbi:ATP synthase subunit 5 [Rhizoctonia solani]|uniref:ATP synthase subunit 5 n=1 Tax=Rhizoctonia solani TaxID=456999 RepID=A0A8H8NYE5_9AGAM|nr:ATP synthase subunit 5 [Rhizoctonia solani]QRW21820.1 ATP synthase subunit 5 [Rhizoctonia solani]